MGRRAKSCALLLSALALFGLTYCTKNQGQTTLNKIVLSHLSFDQSPAEIERIAEAEKTRFLQALDRIGKTPLADAKLENTLFALEKASAEFSTATNPVLFLKYVSPKPEVRAAADKSETSVSKMFVDIFVREDLYSVLKAAQAKATGLDGVDALLMRETLNTFKRNGLELPKEKREIYVAKKKRLVELESQFAKKLVEGDDSVLFTRAELEGLPQSYIDGLVKVGEKFKLTMSYPHFFPFMENGKNAEARKTFEFHFNNKGGVENKDRLEEAIRLRHELAQMLGYATHASFVLEKRMAKDPATVTAFLDRLSVKVKIKGQENLKELAELKQQDLKSSEPQEILSHDWRYYDNMLKKQKYQVDTQAIKEYFPIEVVLKGMFEIYETLLGVQFVKENAKTWHEGVSLYQVKQSGETVAYFYMDLFPREGKYTHAAAFTLVGGYLRGDGSYQAPVSSIVANFNPPVPGKPSLLEHSEVETLFHEFGHIMHQVLTKAKYATFSGTSVKTDFVEAPSQMLENWVWEKEALQKLSGHYSDPTKKLPDALMQKMVNAKNINVGIRYLRQLAFATIDLHFHTSASADTTEVYHRMMKDIMLIPLQEGTLPQASFGHLMGGYDAGYYGYLWSEVYAQDMYTRFEAEGLLNPKTGADYRKWILTPGGETEPFDLLKGFIGREPNENAFLKSLGLEL